MISPGYRHEKDEAGIPIFDKRIQRDPNNSIKLENMITKCMQARHQQELIETLDKKIPILYVDCSQKGEDDIMFHILKEYIKTLKNENRYISLGIPIGNENRVMRNEGDEYIQKMESAIEEMLLHYDQLLKKLFQANNNERHIKSILDAGAQITFSGLDTLMQQEHKKNLYIYLDHTDILTGDEQQRINTLLYARGALTKLENTYVRLKINNGKGVWKTLQTSTGFRTRSCHDFSEINIFEDKL